MIIDAFSHILTQPYIDKMNSILDKPRLHGWTPTTMTELLDYDQRIKDMDLAGIDKQVVTMPSPPTDQLIGVDKPDICAEVCTVINNAMADLADKYPGRFLPIGVTALNNVEFCVKEAERCVKTLGLNGMLTYSNSADRGFDDPALHPFYETMVSLNRPMWIHPTNNPLLESLKYGLAGKYGWPFNSTIAMSELVLGGVMEKFPDLKVITHHAGAMVSFFENRSGGGEGRTPEGVELKKAPNDYYRMIYVDTAIQGSPGAMACSHNFYGSGQMVFGTDYPYVKGAVMQRTVDSVKGMMVPGSQKDQIYSGNITRMLGL